MPLSDQDRIAAERANPRIVSLWHALTALRSTVSFMNSGAHPDDEISTMLAAMRFRDGIDISYACSTRGEGGQNDIGTERGAALGVLRTAEMEAACDRLDLRMYWLSEGPGDTIFDFGFSKSGQETLGRWGRDRTLARFADVVRLERPDILCPTFLDVPGQHGHHRAMTEAAHEVMDLAADPEFAGSALPAWQVSKLYLPAWSGAGQAYDDDLPPPPATMHVPGKGRDPVTGWPYARIGQHSRVMHRTQAMGRWVKEGDESDFPLHLVQSRVDGPDESLTAGLAQNLRDLDLPGLIAVQDACDAAISAFPDAGEVARHASAALILLRGVQGALTEAATTAFGHKLDRKDTQLTRVLHIAAGVECFATLENAVLHPGDTTRWSAELASEFGTVGVSPCLPEGWQVSDDKIQLAEDVPQSDPYPPIYLPGRSQRPCMNVTLTFEGVASTRQVSFAEPPLVLPRHAATLHPEGYVINIQTAQRDFVLQVTDIAPASAAPGLDLPKGWQGVQEAGAFKIRALADVAPGLYPVQLTLDGHPAADVRRISGDHVTSRALTRPAVAQVRVVDVQVPDVRVGYIGGGNDAVGTWLGRLGCDVTDLSDADLSDSALAKCDTLVIGIFAMKFRPGLSDAMSRIHDWVRAGGTLVTLYHRPWDNWDPEVTPPKPLTIGQPSLRWRVTDESAEVTHLVPDHPLLTSPNQISKDDWAGWDKERGLYFASEWDAAYAPLLSMRDADEAPLTGALVAADIGKGRHVHTSLILHHQMEKLTPGAFRLMANLLAKRG